MRNRTTDRLAIRVDAATLLAVPPMHPHTPRATRILVFEYVLRRQIGLAAMVAQATADDLEGTQGARARLASLMAQTPHKNARGAGWEMAA